MSYVRTRRHCCYPPPGPVTPVPFVPPMRAVDDTEPPEPSTRTVPARPKRDASSACAKCGGPIDPRRPCSWSEDKDVWLCFACTVGGMRS